MPKHFAGVVPRGTGGPRSFVPTDAVADLALLDQLPGVAGFAAVSLCFAPQSHNATQRGLTAGTPPLTVV